MKLDHNKSKQIKKELGEEIIDSNIKLQLNMKIYDILCDILDELKKSK